jgi:hypothetical protein
MQFKTDRPVWVVFSFVVAGPGVIVNGITAKFPGNVKRVVGYRFCSNNAGDPAFDRNHGLISMQINDRKSHPIRETVQAIDYTNQAQNSELTELDEEVGSGSLANGWYEDNFGSPVYPFTITGYFKCTTKDE